MNENAEMIFARDLQPWHRFYTPGTTPAVAGFAGPWFERIERTDTSVTVYTVNGGERTLGNDEPVMVVGPSFPTT